MTNLFDSNGGAAAQDKWMSSTGATPVRTDGVAVCTALLVLAKNQAGKIEATMLHLSPGPLSQANQAKLTSIANYEGPKYGVLITSGASSGDALAPDAVGFHTRHVRAAVKDITMVSPVRVDSGKSGISVAYDRASGRMQTWNYATGDVASHTPFTPAMVQAVASGRQKG